MIVIGYIAFNVIENSLMFLSSGRILFCINVPCHILMVCVLLCFQASVEPDGDAFAFTLHCDVVAVFVWLDVEDVAGRFESNGFLLLSQKLTVRFFPWRPTTVVELSKKLHITSLRDVY